MIACPTDKSSSGPAGQDRMTETVIKKLNDRDESVFEDLARLLGKIIKSTAYNITRSKEDSREIYNDVLYEIWRSIPPQNPRSIVAFAISLTRRRSIDRVREYSAKKRKRLEYSLVTEELASDFCTEETVLSNVAVSKVLDDFLSGQTKENRFIFLRRYYDFEPLGKIAKELSLNKNAINLKLVRMRKQLKKELEKVGITVTSPSER